MRWYLFGTAIVFGALSSGQEILRAPEEGTRPILFPADVAILEAADQRKDLGCNVEPDKAVLGIDLKFHGGYQASLPSGELQRNKLTVLFRVIPAGHEPIYFIQNVPIPEGREGSSGAVRLNGEFELGQGYYHVDWLTRDLLGRYCSAHWDLRAQLGAKDREVAVALPPDSVRPPGREQFGPEPSMERAQGGLPIDVKLLVNFAPRNAGAAILDPLDTAGLVSILRAIARNPEIRHFSVTAFNLESRRMLYRQSYGPPSPASTRGAGRSFRQTASETEFPSPARSSIRPDCGRRPGSDDKLAPLGLDPIPRRPVGPSDSGEGRS